MILSKHIGIQVDLGRQRKGYELTERKPVDRNTTAATATASRETATIRQEVAEKQAMITQELAEKRRQSHKCQLREQ